MAGHLGAAVAAGYFIGEDQSELPDEVFRGIEGELDRVIAGEEAIWWNAKKAGLTPADLFQPLPEEEPTARRRSRRLRTPFRKMSARRGNPATT